MSPTRQYFHNHHLPPLCHDAHFFAKNFASWQENGQIERYDATTQVF